MNRPWWGKLPGLRKPWDEIDNLNGEVKNWTLRIQVALRRNQSLAWVVQDVLPELRTVRTTGTFSPNEFQEDDGCPPIDYLIERCERALRGDAT